jgi:hypothetical protein
MQALSEETHHQIELAFQRLRLHGNTKRRASRLLRW